MMTDVFISYRRSERDRCSLIAERLRALGLDVWFDAELESGQHFPDVIDERVQQARAVLVLWSPGAAKSQWVKAEASIGLAEHKLVSAIVEVVRLPVPFNNVHTVDLTKWSGDRAAPAWQEVLRPISRLTGKIVHDPAMLPQHDEGAASGRRRVLLAVTAIVGLSGVVAAGAALWPLLPAAGRREDIAPAEPTLTNAYLFNVAFVRVEPRPFLYTTIEREDTNVAATGAEATQLFNLARQLADMWLRDRTQSTLRQEGPFIVVMPIAQGEHLVYQAGFPYSGEPDFLIGVQIGETPSGSAITADFRGPQSELTQAIRELQAYATQSDRGVTNVVWWEYATPPQDDGYVQVKVFAGVE